MSTITTRTSKGSALTYTEGDNNFTNLNTDKAELTDLASTDNAKGASLVGIEDAGGIITATNVEEALVENREAIDVDEAALATHLADTTTHGTTGDIVGESDIQTLTNKTVVAASNTITTAASGNLAATELNAALAELDSEKLAIANDLSDLNDSFNAAGNLQSGYVVATKAAAEALTPTDGRKIFITSADGGEFTMKTGAAATTYDDDGGTYCGTQFTAGDGSSGFLRDYRETVDARWFTIGDGADENTDLQNLLNASEGKIISFDAGKTYRSNDEIIMKPNCTIEGNGAALNFYALDNGLCLDVKNYCTIRNITVRNLGTESAGDGRYQVPITIGTIDAATGNGIHDVVLENIIVKQTNVANANIAVWADSYNITINNITIEATTGTGLGILVHWGAEDDDAATNGSNHGYNINISNIKCDGMRPVAKPSEGGVVFLSGCYSTNVRNVEAQDVWWAVRVQPGTVGSDKCQTYQEKLILTGIDVSGVVCWDVYQPLSAVWTGDGANSFEHDAGVVFRNCSSNNTTLEITPEISAINIAGLEGVSIRDCYIENHYAGIYASNVSTTDGVSRTNIENVRIKNLAHNGINIKSGTAGLTTDVNISRCKFINTNSTDSTGTVTYSSVIYTDGLRTNITDCVFGEATTETPRYGIYYDANAKYGYARGCVFIGIDGVSKQCIRTPAANLNYVIGMHNLTASAATSNGSHIIMQGTGSPEGVHAAAVGSEFHRTDGGTSTTLYVKETGTTSSTGWAAK